MGVSFQPAERGPFSIGWLIIAPGQSTTLSNTAAITSIAMIMYGDTSVTLPQGLLFDPVCGSSF